MTDNERVAVLTRQTPGGFAGAILDPTSRRPVLLLTDSAQAAAAKSALASILPHFDVAGAEVRQARWTFAQLHDWSRHVNATAFQEPEILTAAIDVARNRLKYGVATATARTRLMERLGALDLPCDLVLVEMEESGIDLPGQ